MFVHACSAPVPFVLAASHVCLRNIFSLDWDVTGGLYFISQLAFSPDSHTKQFEEEHVRDTRFKLKLSFNSASVLCVVVLCLFWWLCSCECFLFSGLSWEKDLNLKETSWLNKDSISKIKKIKQGMDCEIIVLINHCAYQIWFAYQITADTISCSL